MKPFVIVLGIIFVIVGLGVGTHKLTVTQHGETANCAAAFDTLSGDDRQKDQLNRIKATIGGTPTTFETACESKKNTFRILAGVAGVLGFALFVAGLFIPKRTNQ